MYDQSTFGNELISWDLGLLACVLILHLVIIGLACYRLSARSLRGRGYSHQKRQLIRLGVLAEHETASAGDVGELMGTWRCVCAWATIGGSVGAMVTGAIAVPLALIVPRDPEIWGSALELRWFLAFDLCLAAQVLGWAIGRYVGFSAAVRKLPILAGDPSQLDGANAVRMGDMRSPRLARWAVLHVLCGCGLTALIIMLVVVEGQRQADHAALALPISIILAAFPALAGLTLLSAESLTRRLLGQPARTVTPDVALARYGFGRLLAYQGSFLYRLPVQYIGSCMMCEALALNRLVIPLDVMPVVAYFGVYLGLIFLFMAGVMLMAILPIDRGTGLPASMRPRQAMG